MKRLFFLMTLMVGATLYGQELRIIGQPSTYSLHPLESYSSFESQVYSALYEGLFSHEPGSLNPTPALAESYSVSDDGLVYTFIIRENAFFHDGTKITPQMFIDSWVHHLENTDVSNFASLLDIIKGAKAFRQDPSLENREKLGLSVQDGRQLTVQLEHRASYFLGILCHSSTVVMHPSYLNHRNDKSPDFQVIGNGPFELTNRSEESLVMTRANGYWDRENVALSQISYYFSDDRDINSQLYNSGSYHWLDADFDYSAIDRKDHLQINESFSTYFMFANHSRPEMQSVDFRKALAYGVPWNQIRSDELMTFPSGRLVPSISNYPAPGQINSQDLEKAREFLTDSGYEPSQLDPIRFLVVSGSSATDFAQIMGQAWKDNLGIDFTIEEIDFRDQLETIEQGDFDISHLSWIGDYPDPLTFLNMWEAGSSLNNANYNNPNFEDLIWESHGLSGQERFQLLSQAETILLEEGSVYPISHSTSINIVDRDLLNGWVPNVLNIHPFKNMSINLPPPPPNIAGRQ